MLQGTLTFLVSCEIGRGICVWDRRPADAVSGRREDVSSAVFDGGSSSHGFFNRPGTAAYRLRDFAEFGSPRKFAVV